MLWHSTSPRICSIDDQFDHDARGLPFPFVQLLLGRGRRDGCGQKSPPHPRYQVPKGQCMPANPSIPLLPRISLLRPVKESIARACNACLGPIFSSSDSPLLHLGEFWLTKEDISPKG